MRGKAPRRAFVLLSIIFICSGMILGADPSAIAATLSATSTKAALGSLVQGGGNSLYDPPALLVNSTNILYGGGANGVYFMHVKIPAYTITVGSTVCTPTFSTTFSKNSTTYIWTQVAASAVSCNGDSISPVVHIYLSNTSNVYSLEMYVKYTDTKMSGSTSFTTSEDFPVYSPSGLTQKGDALVDSVPTNYAVFNYTGLSSFAPSVQANAVTVTSAPSASALTSGTFDPTLVQSGSNVNSASSSITCVLNTTPVIAGDTIFAVVASSAAANTEGFSDGLSGAQYQYPTAATIGGPLYTIIESPFTSSSGQLYFVEGTGGSSDTITFPISGGTSASNIDICAEFSGAAAPAQYKAESTVQIATGTSASVSVALGTAFQPATAANLVVIVMSVAVCNGLSAITPPSGFSLVTYSEKASGTTGCASGWTTYLAAYYSTTYSSGSSTFATTVASNTAPTTSEIYDNIMVFSAVLTTVATTTTSTTTSTSTSTVTSTTTTTSTVTSTTTSTATTYEYGLAISPKNASLNPGQAITVNSTLVNFAHSGASVKWYWTTDSNPAHHSTCPEVITYGTAFSGSGNKTIIPSASPYDVPTGSYLYICFTAVNPSSVTQDSSVMAILENPAVTTTTTSTSTTTSTTTSTSVTTTTTTTTTTTIINHTYNILYSYRSSCLACSSVTLTVGKNLLAGQVLVVYVISNVTNPATTSTSFDTLTSNRTGDAFVRESSSVAPDGEIETGLWMSNTTSSHGLLLTATWFTNQRNASVLLYVAQDPPAWSYKMSFQNSFGEWLSFISSANQKPEIIYLALIALFGSLTFVLYATRKQWS